MWRSNVYFEGMTVCYFSGLLYSSSSLDHSHHSKLHSHERKFLALVWVSCHLQLLASHHKCVSHRHTSMLSLTVSGNLGHGEVCLCTQHHMLVHYLYTPCVQHTPIPTAWLACKYHTMLVQLHHPSNVIQGHLFSVVSSFNNS